MHDVGLWLSFSSCHRQLSFALPKALYLNWHLISIRPQVVCKVSRGKIRERSFHLLQKKARYFRRVHLLHLMLLTGHVLDLYSSFIMLFKVDRPQTTVVAKNLSVLQLFISTMPKMCAILQLVSAPLNPIPIAEHFRRSHPQCEHSCEQHIYMSKENNAKQNEDVI